MGDEKTAQILRFEYCNAAGELSIRTLSGWLEQGHYIKGRDADKGRVLTFRKDRVQAYLDKGDSLLRAPIAPPPPKLERSAPPDRRPQILFTGFASATRTQLQAQADEAGLRVVQTVTQGLTFLCTGANAGPSKVDKARIQGVYIVSEPQLRELLATGVLADEVVDALSEA